MFLGTVLLVAKQLSNNNGQFFKDFTTIRSRLERIMIEFKDLIAMIVQNQVVMSEWLATVIFKCGDQITQAGREY